MRETTNLTSDDKDDEVFDNKTTSLTGKPILSAGISHRYGSCTIPSSHYLGYTTDTSMATCNEADIGTSNTHVCSTTPKISVASCRANMTYERRFQKKKICKHKSLGLEMQETNRPIKPACKNESRSIKYLVSDNFSSASTSPGHQKCWKAQAGNMLSESLGGGRKTAGSRASKGAISFM